MIPDRLETPSWSTSILESVDADGVKKLREHHPPPRRRRDLPHVKIWKIHQPSDKLAKTGEKRRSAKIRRHEPSASTHPSPSTLDPSMDDRQINIESEFLKKDDAHPSDIPIRVVSPADSLNATGQAMPMISQSVHLQVSYGPAKSPVTVHAETSPVTEPLDVSANIGPNGAAERTSNHDIYDEPGPTNTLQIRLSPQHHFSDVTGGSTGNNTQASFSTLAGVCNHSYEEVIVRRCRYCGCHLSIEAAPSGATNYGSLRPFSRPSETADNYLTGTSISANDYELLAMLSGFSTWDHHQAVNQACAGASGAMIGPMSPSPPVHRGAQSNLYPSPLMIPESMQYRESHSSISASPSSYSPGSSSFQSTPVSSSSQSYLSPLLYFPDLSSDSPSGGWPAPPQFGSDGFPSS